MAIDNNLNKVDSDKVRTLLMVLDGAIKNTKIARAAMDNNDDTLRGESISKIIAILTQLDCALDKKVGGEIAENLSGLYKYMMNRLTFANVHDDPEIILEVEKLLINIKEGFDGAALKTINDKQSDIPEKLDSNQRGLRIDI